MHYHHIVLANAGIHRTFAQTNRSMDPRGREDDVFEARASATLVVFLTFAFHYGFLATKNTAKML